MAQHDLGLVWGCASLILVSGTTQSPCCTKKRRPLNILLRERKRWQVPFSLSVLLVLTVTISALHWQKLVWPSLWMSGIRAESCWNLKQKGFMAKVFQKNIIAAHIKKPGIWLSEMQNSPSYITPRLCLIYKKRDTRAVACKPCHLIPEALFLNAKWVLRQIHSPCPCNAVVKSTGLRMQRSHLNANPHSALKFIGIWLLTQMGWHWFPMLSCFKSLPAHPQVLVSCKSFKETTSCNLCLINLIWACPGLPSHNKFLLDSPRRPALIIKTSGALFLSALMLCVFFV